jgi:hypothetical protein
MGHLSYPAAVSGLFMKESQGGLELPLSLEFYKELQRMKLLHFTKSTTDSCLN